MYNTCNLVYAQGMQIIDMLYRACMGNILELCKYSYMYVYPYTIATQPRSVGYKTFNLGSVCMSLVRMRIMYYTQ